MCGGGNSLYFKYTNICVLFKVVTRYNNLLNIEREILSFNKLCVSIL